jgi:hypothetical protein
MAKSANFDNQLLQLIFNAVPIAGLAMNNTTSPLGSLVVALHTADPTASGNQSTNEIAYTGYTRVSVVRTSSGFVVTGASVSPAANISFPPGTGGSGTASFFSVGAATSGAGEIFYSGPITPPIVCGAGITPTLTTGSTITET